MPKKQPTKKPLLTSYYHNRKAGSRNGAGGNNNGNNGPDGFDKFLIQAASFGIICLFSLYVLANILPIINPKKGNKP